MTFGDLVEGVCVCGVWWDVVVRYGDRIYTVWLYVMNRSCGEMWL